MTIRKPAQPAQFPKRASIKERLPMVRHSRKGSGPRGFALIVTISMMILLALLAVGLLSLSTISLRTSARGFAQAEAQANARLALGLAVAELQKALGDDRRITANGSMLTDTGQTHSLGVWESWSPRMTDDPTASAPDYEGEKEKRFIGWMASGKEEELNQVDWAKKTLAAGDSVRLFGESSDGFEMRAELVDIKDDDRQGAMAWAVTQEATKAKITVPGQEADQRLTNDDLQAQPRPSLAENEFYGEPTGGWNKRSTKVLSLSQAELDKDLWKGDASIPGGAHFTTKGSGLLTNVVDGGLKIDMSLGFGLGDSDFETASWSDGETTFTNPFHASSIDSFGVPGTYSDQRPLYRPLEEKGTYEVKKEFWPANVQFHFPITSVPTFHSLRSYYRTPYHLYETDSGLTVFERPSDHVAGKAGRIDRGYFPSPAATNEGDDTQLGIRPVLDRTMFLVSGGLSDTDELRIVITPIITMWNPYNVALEIEGSVAYVWIDIPYDFSWRTYGSNGRLASNEYMYMSGLMGKQFNNQDHARSVDPYFFAAITADGQALSRRGRVDPIRFEPGEVRVFAPASQKLKDFDVSGSIRDRTVFLRPVDSLDQFSTNGGLSIPTKNFVRNQGFIRNLKKDQTAQLTFASIKDQDYPFYISLEDATRAKGSNPDREDRGQAIADVLSKDFSQSGELVEFRSPRIPYARLKQEPVPIGVLESYHRVARQGGDAQIADLVFTGNPRQPWMNPYITNTRFETGPQYQIRMRAVSSFNGVLQSANQGRSAYYGASQTPIGGRTHLSFFEIPSAPLLSLAAFQHADLSATPFAPANQFANSWASAYVPSSLASEGPLEVDHSYLLNEALWDGWFFSGAAPTITHSSGSGSPQVWEQTEARITRETRTALEEFFEDPFEHPLRNPRMEPIDSPADPQELAESLVQPEGCLKIAADLMVDGAFNVNSTSVEAWTSVLSGLRDATFDVDQKSTDHNGRTPFPRFRDPVGTADDKWHGYRTLSDAEVRKFAENLVEEVRKRGPFLSLSEFVNRRIAKDEMALRGALQEAIDRSELNDSAKESEFSTASYEGTSRENIAPNDTAVGIPGYLTQADVLKSIASVITVRSDTFTIRSYGDSQDASGNVIAKAWAEATVQRIPEFVDASEFPYTPVDELNETNKRFGRRLRVVSFRFIPDAEVTS